MQLTSQRWTSVKTHIHSGSFHGISDTARLHEGGSWISLLTKTVHNVQRTHQVWYQHCGELNRSPCSVSSTWKVNKTRFLLTQLQNIYTDLHVCTVSCYSRTFKDTCHQNTTLFNQKSHFTIYCFNNKNSLQTFSRILFEKIIKMLSSLYSKV